MTIMVDYFMDKSGILGWWIKEKGPRRTIDSPFSMEDRLVDDLRTPHERCTVLQREKSRRNFKTPKCESTPTRRPIKVENLRAPDRTIGANIIPFL